MNYNERCNWLKKRRQHENISVMEIAGDGAIPLAWVEIAETPPRPGYAKYVYEQLTVWKYWLYRDRITRWPMRYLKVTILKGKENYNEFPKVAGWTFKEG